MTRRRDHRSKSLKSKQTQSSLPKKSMNSANKMLIKQRKTFKTKFKTNPPKQQLKKHRQPNKSLWIKETWFCRRVGRNLRSMILANSVQLTIWPTWRTQSNGSPKTEIRTLNQNLPPKRFYPTRFCKQPKSSRKERSCVASITSNRIPASRKWPTSWRSTWTLGKMVSVGRLKAACWAANPRRSDIYTYFQIKIINHILPFR